MDQLDGMSGHPSTRSFHDPPMSLNPLIRGVKAGQVGGSLHRRHASVAPRFMDKADEKALYFSPSRMQLGLRDAVFQGGDQLTSSQKNADFAALKTRNPSGLTLGGVGSLRAARRPQGGLSGLTSPAGAGLRQENYLLKMQSEKRNKHNFKKFSNSGFGLRHNHPVFNKQMLHERKPTVPSLEVSINDE